MQHEGLPGIVPLALFAALALCVGAAATARPAAAAEESGEPVHLLAKPRTPPPGAPKASDVIMRSLGLHPRNKKDPHDTLQALADFHVTRLEWAYIADKKFVDEVKALGIVFGGAAAAPSYDPPGKAPGWFENVVIVDLDGKPIIAPWKRSWGHRSLWGCVNNPELERGYMQYLKRYIDAGAQVMQRDEPGSNLGATSWGGCFCAHCVKGFRDYLAEHTTPDKRRQLGIADITAFDYREHLRQKAAPVGDSFRRWDGGELKKLFVEFQTQATVAFHERTRAAIDQYAGRRVPFSCNNGVWRWTGIERGFDWAFGELSYKAAKARRLHAAMREAEEHGRLQVVTMPKKSNYDDPEEWVRRTRCTIAMAYACGGHCMAPWDVYMPRDAPRYFGTPKHYADLFGFIRANAGYLDGYEEAAAVGADIDSGPAVGQPPVRIVGSEDVCAVVRAVPGRADLPAVVHLVDWSDEPAPFTLVLNPLRFHGQRPLKLRLLTPSAYSKREHDDAQKTGEYSSLCQCTPLASGYRASVQVPALAPWGLVIVEPVSGPPGGVWTPAIWAEPIAHYMDPLEVRMACASGGAVVRYTTDGQEPAAASPRYAGAFMLTDSAVVKARAFMPNGRASETAAAPFSRVDGCPTALQPDAGGLEPSLKLWLRADVLEGALKDGDAVATWTASAGPDAQARPMRLYDGQQAAPPTFRANALNGKPVVRFDGVDDHLSIKGFANEFLAGKAFTVLMLTRADSAAFGICGNGLNGDGGVPRLYLTRGCFRYDVLDRGLSTRSLDTSSTISTFMHDGRETISAYFDGVAAGSLAGFPVVPKFGGGHLAMPFWGGNRNCPGDMAELIVFDRALSDRERESVETYLADKYRLKYRLRWR